jgi:hypothetical protein
MFKKFFILSLVLSCFLVVLVNAQPDIGLGTAQGIAQQSGLSTSGATETGLAETIGRYINLLLGFTGIIFLLLTLYAGYLWMFGGGNEENIAKAKKILTSSTVGVVIVLLSYSTTSLILYFVAGTTKPEYSELQGTDPSVYSGCCFVPISGCTKKVGVGAAADEVPCGDCYENQGKPKCDEVGGRWLTNTCAKAQNDYEFRCEQYRGIIPD